MEKLYMLINRRLKTVKRAILPKLIHRFSTILIRIPVNFIVEINKMILWNYKGLEYIKTIMGKEQRKLTVAKLTNKQQ